jgi:hypothetical protein
VEVVAASGGAASPAPTTAAARPDSEVSATRGGEAALVSEDVDVLEPSAGAR